MQREQEQSDDVKGRDINVLKAINHHRINVIVAERVSLEQLETAVGRADSKMRQMVNDKHQHNQTAYHHVPRSEASLDVFSFDVAVRTSAPILDREQDREINMERDRDEQNNPNDPEKNSEIAQMLGVIVDPTRAQENLEIAQQMTDDKQHQDHARDRNDHFFADG